jgi:hypothetical protein
MLKSIDIWKKLPGDRLVRYRCFEFLGEGGYCVQSADFFTLPVDDAQLRFSEKQFLELLIEEDPRTRCAIYPTLEQAIQAHERDFDLSEEARSTPALTP